MRGWFSKKRVIVLACVVSVVGIACLGTWGISQVIHNQQVRDQRQEQKQAEEKARKKALAEAEKEKPLGNGETLGDKESFMQFLEINYLPKKKVLPLFPQVKDSTQIDLRKQYVRSKGENGISADVLESDVQKIRENSNKVFGKIYDKCYSMYWGWYLGDEDADMNYVVDNREKWNPDKGMVFTVSRDNMHDFLKRYVEVRSGMMDVVDFKDGRVIYKLSEDKERGYICADYNYAWAIDKDPNMFTIGRNLRSTRFFGDPKCYISKVYDSGDFWVIYIICYGQ